MTKDPAPESEYEFETDAEEEGRMLRRYHLGAIAESSARMEATLRAVFAALLGSPRATVVAAGQSVTWLSQNALAIIDTNDDVRGPSLGNSEAVTVFRAAIKRCGDLYEKRNHLIHGAWFDGVPSPMYSRSKWRKPFAFAVQVPMQEIEGLAAQLDSAVEELLEASFQVKGIIAGT